ncbi:NADPH-dependent F420 reductase [Microbacterium aerolatum]|uniref:NADPH-dependent F420 reductase n=1 Tax=Microbacterium aerolatum TaxID=153731 RepID=UPI002001BBAD|nr:NADPH-dependent F420 reductase [Microbacterium aerolatum]MCK3769819.1 NADPH-dependent F420 reductase [Microbacterium aerolatum]
MTTIAVLGVGRVGSAVARTALRAGFDVRVAGSGAAEDIALIAEIVMPGAVAMTTADAVRDADIVIVAVPLHKHRSVAPAPLAGKVVIDAMNWWTPVDGDSDEFDHDDASTSEVVAQHFVGARLVKTLNHIGYHELEEHGTDVGAPGRRALAVASDDEDAAQLVATMIDRFGFDAVYAGPLRAGRGFGPGTLIFNSILTRDELESALPAHEFAL